MNTYTPAPSGGAGGGLGAAGAASQNAGGGGGGAGWAATPLLGGLATLCGFAPGTRTAFGGGGAACRGGGGGGGYAGGGGGGAYDQDYGGGGGGGGTSFIDSAVVLDSTISADWSAIGDEAPRVQLVATVQPTPSDGGGSSTPVTVTIGLNSNGGQGSAQSLSGGMGTWVSLPGAGTLSRLGYTFAGWNTAADGSGTAFAAGVSIQLNGDNNLYAQWASATPSGGTSGGAGSSTAGPNADYTPIPLAQPLRAGQSLLTVAGESVPVTVRPNASGDPVALVVSAPSLTPALTMRLEGRGDESDPLGLTSKHALVLQSQVVQRSAAAKVVKVQPVAQSSGGGFKANSTVKFYILPSTYLGALTTNGSGAYDGSLAIPAGVLPGVYTLQANGFAPDGAVRSLSIGVLVKPTTVAAKLASAKAFFAAMSSVLTEEGKSTLRALVQQTGKQGVRTVAVGYVQSSASTGNDQSLSTARARNVAAFLRSLGLKGAFVVRGDGVATQTGAAARRVNVTVTYRT